MSDGRGSRFPVGVADPCLDDAGEGDARPVGAAMNETLLVIPIRGSGLAAVPVLVFLLAPGCGRLLPRRGLLMFRAFAESAPWPFNMTEEAGELPGVSYKLPTVERSFESILETESLSCWFFLST